MNAEFKRRGVRQPEAIDFRAVVDGVKARDEAAIERFFTFTSKLTRSFLGRLPNADDLAHEVATKAVRAVVDFEPPDEATPESFDKALNSWVFTIASNKVKDDFRRKRRQVRETGNFASVEETFAAQDNQADQPRASAQDIHEALQIALAEKASELLANRPSILAVVELALQGKSHAEIAQELGISEGNVRQRLFRGRKPLEEKLIKPAGFNRAAAFGTHVRNAIVQGRIDGLQFLGQWYVTKEKADRYEGMQRRIVNTDLLAQGYVLLYTHASAQTYDWLISSQPDSPQRAHLHQKQGRLYIKTRDLAYWETNRPKTKPYRIRPPEGGLEHIRTIANTKEEYHILQYAAKKGELAHKIARGILWTERQEAEAYLARRGLRPSGTIYP